MTKGRTFVGTSGWIYPHWGNGVFYPEGLREKDWLDYYCQYFDTVEINNTFYHLPQKRVFVNWRKSTPKNFTFVLKASRFITHMKKLKDPDVTAKTFLEHASGLEEKLGLMLFQLPPFWKLNLDRFEEFVEYLNKQKIVPNVGFSIELRNRTWLCEETIKILREGNVALCFADWPDLNIKDPVTADFIYIRRHGAEALYSSCYSEEELKRDASRMKGCITKGMDAYIYFNNDAHGWAIKNALRIKEMLREK